MKHFLLKELLFTTFVFVAWSGVLLALRQHFVRQLGQSRFTDLRETTFGALIEAIAEARRAG
ncbi:MAG: hypothetical protein M1396_02820 [Chloroflexi bacterium]|nr:hypothetical protein [Chloroflexota bacterium]